MIASYVRLRRRHSRRLYQPRLCRRSRQADRRLSRPPVRELALQGYPGEARPDHLLRPRPPGRSARRHRRRRCRHLHLPACPRRLRHFARSLGRRHRQGLAELHHRRALDPLVGWRRQFDRTHRLAQPATRHPGSGIRVDRGQWRDRRRADRRADLHRRLGSRFARQPGTGHQAGARCRFRQP